MRTDKRYLILCLASFTSLSGFRLCYIGKETIKYWLIAVASFKEITENAQLKQGWIILYLPQLK